MMKHLAPLGILVLCAAQLAAAQTDNHGIHAVPAPETVTIDGALDEWDRSGEILICYDVASLKDVYSGRVSMMHDAQALYVAIDWRDPHPMGNSHDPQFLANRGWAGDSVQLRLKTDRITHLTAWYFADRQEPCLQVDYGKSLSEPFNGGGRTIYRSEGWRLEDGVEMAFAAHAEGDGYVQEMKIPWSLITLGGREAIGSQFACGVELLWGEEDWPVHRYADNLQEGETSREFFWTAHGSWGPVYLSPEGDLDLPTPAWAKALELAAPEGPIEIRYNLDRRQRVTIAIDDAAGTRVRNLVAAVEREAGEHVERWDCLDDEGQLVAPGTYTYRAIRHDGLHLTYQGSYASPADPPWTVSNGKGAYYGDHTAPEAVCFGPGERGAVACPMGEAGNHLIGVNLAGERQWGLANRRAFAGGRIALATDGDTLYVANVDARRNEEFTIWRCALEDGSYRAWDRRDEHGKAVLDLPISEGDGLQQLRGIALHDGVLAVTMHADRRILLLHGETGDELASIDDLPAEPRAVAYDAEGRLLVACGAQLLRIDRDGGQREVLTEDLDHPADIAVDAAGAIYVSQHGAAMNVGVYDADGQRLREVGRRGGRPARGRFDETGMYAPVGIAIASDGRLWVTERDDQPKRTSVWEPDGSLAFDLIGTTSYCAGGTINPFDHHNAVSESTEYRFDEVRGQWRPVYSFPDALDTGHGWIGRFARVGGREYLQYRATARGCGRVKILVRTDDGGWRHCAEFGNVGRGGSIGEARHRRFNQTFTGPLWDGHFQDVFCWVDADDDGQASPDEMQFVADRDINAGYWGVTMGMDLSVVLPQDGGDFWRLAPTGFTAGGTPLFDLDEHEVVEVPGFKPSEGMLLVGREGRMYLNNKPLRAVDADGELLWTYPNPYISVHGSHKAPASRQGLLIGPSSIYGNALVDDEVGEVIMLNGNLGQTFLFTEDGLWVQSLFNDVRGWYDVPERAVVGMPCDAMTAGSESFGGGFVKSDDGRYYVIGGATAAVIYECTGLDSIQRFRGQVAVDADDLAVADELRIARAAETKADKRYAIRRVDQPPVMDGSLEGWGMGEGGAEIVGGAGQVGRAKVRYDDRNLYLAWRVRDRSPLRNAGQDERLMFITGDCVDLMLRTTESDSAKPVAGDLRLVLSMLGEEPIAVLYVPVDPDAPEGERAVLSSPTRDVPFDRVTRIDIPVQMRRIDGGYGVTATVPLATLGLADPAGRTLRGDFGVLLSDSTGRECTSRNYWSNKAANNTSDIPDEAALQPALWSALHFAE